MSIHLELPLPGRSHLTLVGSSHGAVERYGLELVDDEGVDDPGWDWDGDRYAALAGAIRRVGIGVFLVACLTCYGLSVRWVLRWLLGV